MIYEVRSKGSEEYDYNTDSGGPDSYIPETRRTSRKDAEQDLEMLKMFGKTAWIVEIQS